LRTVLAGERKQVTVLFADLKSSTEMLAERDPEEGRRLLDPVLEHMMESVHHFEGTVSQVLGDGIMALFGAPLAHEDHAVRACRAALLMQERVTAYGDAMQRAHGVPVQIRVGLNSGEVVVRSVESDLRMDYTAIGPTTLLAARMEQMAKPGTVLLTAETLRLVEGYVRVKPLGALTVRGFADPVEVFELVGAGVARTRLQVAAARGLTRFVGRKGELDALRSAADRAAAGQGGVVALVGEPGVGKSRLVWEFARSHRTHGWRVLEAIAVSYGTATPYLPVIDLLRMYFEIEPRDEPRRLREKVLGKLLALDRSLEPAIPVVLGLLGVGADAQDADGSEAAQRRQDVLEALGAMFLRESEVQPMLVVVEDLHWSDRETLAILDGLVDRLQGARVLLLVNYRPEHRHGWVGKPHYAPLRIDALTGAPVAELLDVLLGRDPTVEPLKRLLIERTQGNPFFVEESVQALEETQALAGTRGAYQLVRPLPTLHVPITVQAVLAARIDRLSPEDKRTLQSAAAIGRTVPLPLLAAVTGLADSALRSGLERLQSAEFLYDTALFPVPEYAFKHPLTIEVAYSSLLLEERRALHLRIVDAFEALHPERVSERADWLAHHAFRAEAWPKALVYLRRAGAGLPDLDAAILGGADSPTRLWWSGEHERALRAAERELAVAASFGNFGLRVVSRFRLGQIHFSLGDYGRAAEALRGNVGALEGDLRTDRVGMVGLPSVFSRAWLAWCLAEQGAFDEAVAIGEEAVQIAESVEHAYSLSVADFGLGAVHLIRGDLERAAAVLERSVVLARVHDASPVRPFAGALLGAAYARAGRAAQALSHLEQAVQQAAVLKLAAHQAIRLVWLAEAVFASGDRDRAASLAERALALAREHRERGHEAYALRLVAEVQAAGGTHLAEAREHFALALHLAETLQMRPLVVRCQRGLDATRDA
jgi:class 3 adenylate cyclase/tetratricopeptide (TPR) repeat protein